MRENYDNEISGDYLNWPIVCASHWNPRKVLTYLDLFDKV